MGDDGGDPVARPLFVYGTLQPGQPGFRELALDGRVALLGPTCVRGTLYDLGEYPGLVLNGVGLVRGQLLRPLDAGLLPLIDAYEMYDAANPDNSEYLRVEVNVGGDHPSCWIYVYNWPLRDARMVPGGEWLPAPGS